MSHPFVPAEPPEVEPSRELGSKFQITNLKFQTSHKFQAPNHKQIRFKKVRESTLRSLEFEICDLEFV